MQAEFGYEQMVHFEHHLNDPLSSPGTELRADLYGVAGIPVVRIDGIYSVLGASSCEGAAAAYREKILQRLDETEGMSPVEITGTFIPFEEEASLQATFRLVDPVQLENLRGYILLYEDDLLFLGEIWQHTTRHIYTRCVDLNDVGEEVTIAARIPLHPDWNPEKLHAVAFVQEVSGTKQIVQGKILPRLFDYTVEFDRDQCSIPGGNGVADFDGTIVNAGTIEDRFTISLGDDFGWPTVFFVGSDPTPRTEPLDVVLGSGQSCPIRLRAATDGTRTIRSGSIRVVSDRSERVHRRHARIFNGSPSVILVDDDYFGEEEISIIAALDSLGYLFDHWDVVYEKGKAAPSGEELARFDVAVWQTGFSSSSLLMDWDMTALMEAMDAGTALFFTSQQFLDKLEGESNDFVADYLGVAGWRLGRAYTRVDGVAGDAIGDSLALPLTFGGGCVNRADDAEPGPGALTFLVGGDGSSAAIRNDPAGETARSVFMPMVFTAISGTDPDPNNIRAVLARILGWLLPADPGGADDPAETVALGGAIRVQPNPTRGEGDLVWTAGGAPPGRIRIDLLDSSGRKIAEVLETSGPAHSRGLRLDLDALPGGRPKAGVYFLRWSAPGARGAAKVVLID